jgi:hypothetical protein
MSNAYRVAVGKYVSYLRPHNAGTHPNDTLDVRWCKAYIVSVTDQTHVVLAIRNPDKSLTNLNGGVAVAKWTRAKGVTNVWRPY